MTVTGKTTEDLALCGWRVRSEWPLPELMAWHGADGPADILIRRGDVSANFSGTVRRTPLVEVNDRNWLRFTVRNVAEYLVRDGNEVIVDTPHPDDTPDVGLFLLGSVLGFLCHQRGLLPLHASCVALDGRVIAFAGHSGSGKSTVAAQCLVSGGRLLSDDVTVVDMRAAGGPIVLPTFPRQKLWRDTLNALGLAPGRHLRRAVDLAKFDRPVSDAFDGAPARLDAIYHLHARKRDGAPQTAPMNGLQSVRALYDNIYRRTAAGLLGFSDRVFQDCALLANAVPVHALAMPEGIGAVGRMGSHFERILAAGP